MEIYYIIETIANATYRSVNVTGDIGKKRDKVVMEDSQDTLKISIPIVDDSSAEPDEIFRVRLESVQLVSPAYNESQLPRIGTSSSIRVIIEANDGAQGELSFAADSVK